MLSIPGASSSGLLEKLQSENQWGIGGMKHLFITGLFRSGTSLLSTALNVHPDVIVGWQPFWLFFKECRNKFFKDIIGAPIDPEYPMGVLHFRSEDESKLFQDVLHQVRFGNSELASVIYKIKAYFLNKSEKINSDMKPAELSKHIDDLESGSAGHVLEQLLERLQLAETDQEGKKLKRDQIGVVGIKEVFCEEYIEPILSYEGLDSSAIHIIRDPRGIVASRNYGKYFMATGYKYPVFFMIRSWQRTVAQYVQNMRQENYLMMKYEELVRDPEKSLREVCSLLGLEFSEDLLNPDKYTDASGMRWQSNSSFESVVGIDRSPIDRWKEILPKEEVELIEYWCHREMDLLGYEVGTKAFDKNKICGFQEDMSHVKPWLKSYDFSMPRGYVK
jgi:hypothetical protein